MDPSDGPSPVTLPLADVRVCDLTQNLAGPFCCQILGDLGAEVIKVEPPNGDTARPWGPPFWGGESALFLSVNRNKRSIILDLKSSGGREVIHRIARESDVFVQASRLGVSERLGCDYQTIRALREDVIHMSLTAYGKRGPLKDFPGYDPLMQAFAGIMSVTGHPDTPAARVGGSVVDFGTGMWAAIAILSALRARDATGQGAELETALLDTAVGWVAYHLIGYMATGEIPGPMGSGLLSIAPYQAFPTSDGSVMISAGNDAIFARLCEALEVGELTKDPRFLTNPDRVANREELIPIFESLTGRFDTAELLTLMHRHSVPCSPIQNIAEVASDPQVESAELLTPAFHPEIPDYREVALPLRMDGVRPRGGSPPPGAGEHTMEILADLGYSSREADRLIQEGSAATSV